MARSVLVAFATKRGSTEEVAQAVAATLRQAGLDVMLQPANAVGDLGDYDAVVLGGALYMGRLHRDARRLLRRFHKDLAEMPVAVFGMGPLTMTPHDVDGSRKQLDAALRKTPDVVPVAVTIFGGVVHQDEQTFPFNHMPETDARDWSVIHAWAEEVAASLEPNPVSAASTRSGSVSRL
jgi:menaquinone-dependent protoporphyrinogen oxidase